MTCAHQFTKQISNLEIEGRVDVPPPWERAGSRKLIKYGRIMQRGDATRPLLVYIIAN